MLTQLGGSQADQLDISLGDARLFTVHNSPLVEMLFDRRSTGLKYKRMCAEASSFFFRHIADELAREGLSELMVLSKGYAYQLGRAFEEACGLNLPTNFIATERVKVSSDDASIASVYERFDAGGSRIVIGDTVASGATIETVLRAYSAQVPLRDVYIFSYAGSLDGAKRIANFCGDSGIKVTMMFGLAAFGLGANGFDLSFLHPDTVTRDEYVARAAEVFSNRPVSAVGWDFGSQFIAPSKYRRLTWVEANSWGLLESPQFAEAEEPPSYHELRKEQGAFTGDVTDSNDEE